MRRDAVLALGRVGEILEGHRQTRAKPDGSQSVASLRHIRGREPDDKIEIARGPQMSVQDHREPADDDVVGIGQRLKDFTEIEGHRITSYNVCYTKLLRQSHRPDVIVYLVLESTRDFSRTIRFDINAMHDIGGFDERRNNFV